ncbi:relaxase/mobilization nuclease domain-containing protein [Gordonia amicalis]|uniref:Relaxase/mobilization nuclease domain-containing protein n=1 Tax=Gordonia amicalis TaxID=89053 RepID=A0ABU4DEC2_9ACTN|nr:relaxase/mobilization nuclease domain-containing protein [Gordonia amicalis]MDV6308090.1 relaxase/mobilization nuclease domain-containing protein [Gordonia amicalis]
MTVLAMQAATYLRGAQDYLLSAAAHDLDRPGGAHQRVELASTLGPCEVKSFTADVMAVKEAYGKKSLEVDAYSFVISHHQAELDPLDDSLGEVAHGLAREWAAREFPGRQALLVTQRDNGRWEKAGDEQVWVEGHWHTHVLVGNVAYEQVSLSWADAQGRERTKHYGAGRAMDGDLKNVHRLRHDLDAVIAEQWQYDNAAFVKACGQRVGQGSGAGIEPTRQDLAQRAERGRSEYDEVRAQLLTVQSQATSWDDYTSKLAAVGVGVRVRKNGGTSYDWVSSTTGEQRRARAVGARGLGEPFQKDAVERVLTGNAERVQRGETLEVLEPDEALEQVLAPPPRDEQQPRPQFQTPDGRPPWVIARERDAQAYEARLAELGGTYADRAETVLVTQRALEGVQLQRASADQVTAVVQTPDGPVTVDVDAELARRVAAVRKLETTAIATRDEYLVEAVAEAQEIVAGAREQAVEIRATAETEARAKAAEIVEGAEVQADDIRATAVAEATEIKTAAEQRVREVGAELERRCTAVDQREQQLDQREQQLKLDEREVAEGRAANEARAEELRGAADRLDLEYEALRAREAEYDPKKAVESMSVARYQAGEKLQVPVLQPDGTRVKRTFNEVLDEQAAKYKGAEAARTVGEMRERTAKSMATLNKGRSNVRAVDKQTGMQQKKGQYGPEMG